MSNNSEQIESAYKYCESVTRLHAKSFYFAARFLSKEKQPAIYALYALCRHVDDEVDEAEIAGEEQIRAAVNRWQSKLNEIYADDGGEIKPETWNLELGTDGDRDLVFLAWRDFLQKYKIPQSLPLELMKGVLMDTHVNRYETFDELYVYCYRVASTVGLMSSEIFGYERPETLDYAEALGIAMQMTNILRDVGEDAAMNRIYLPLEDLKKFNVSEEQIFANRADENFVELMKFEIERAREFYRKAERGVPLLSPDARFAVLLAARLYARILDEIERQNYDVFKRRARTNFKQKVFAVPRIWREARNMQAKRDEGRGTRDEGTGTSGKE
jgi:15-cis-phytoene synthase